MGTGAILHRTEPNRGTNMNTPLEQVLISLNEIKASIHNETNTSATEKLDEAIVFIQQCIENGCNDRKSLDAAILVIGKFLEKLPSIVALIKYLSD